jgi:D-alanyl-D-alanine carboxypeptidase/D-alanyl-D-alanine-endopeptidase (penicillin-binding protein 4)
MRRALGLLAALLTVLTVAAPAHAISRDELRAALAAEFAGAGAHAGAYAQDLESGEELFAARPDTARIPASVEKLLVTGTAFLRLGADAALQTRAVATSAPDDAGAIDGDLVLVGTADPTLGDAGLRRLADGVAAAGVTEVRGAVVAEATPGALPPGAAARFERALRAAGVAVAGGTAVGLRPDPATSVPVAAVAWSTLARLARRINVPSDNALAERLLRSLGALGGAATTSGGAAVVRETLGDLGIRPRVVDGSGLSRANRTTPREVVRLLEGLDASAAGPAFRATLAVAGRTGTVRRRMRGTPAQGACAVKTGTLRSVSTLAGVCRTTGGGDVAFAWMMNATSPWTARAVQDRMTVLVSRYDPATG